MSKNIKQILREAGVLLVAALLVLTALVMVPTTMADSSVVLLEESDWPGTTNPMGPYAEYYFPGYDNDWTDENKIAYYWGWWQSDTSKCGSSLEAMLDFNLTLPNYVFYSDDFSTVGYIDCVLEFNSYIDYYPSVNGPYSLNAGWSTDATTWYPVWSETPTTDTLYTGVSVSLPSTAENEPIVYIGFWVEGFNMWMNYWYIDDVKVIGAECSVESVIAAINAIWDYIDLLDCNTDPPDPPDFSTPCKKNTLYNMLILDDDSVIGFLTQVPPDYGEAKGTLVNAIRPKMDGDDTPSDWIINSDAQEDLCEMIDNLIPCLESLAADG